MFNLYTYFTPLYTQDCVKFGQKGVTREKKKPFCRNLPVVAGETAHGIRALAALPEGTGLLPSTHLAACVIVWGRKLQTTPSTEPHQHRSSSSLNTETRGAALLGLGQRRLWHLLWLPVSRHLVMHLGMVRFLKSQMCCQGRCDPSEG